MDGICLRKAIGRYWLVDMRQDYSCYVSPIEINETVAEFYICLNKSGSMQAACREMAELYEISEDVIRNDMTPVFERIGKLYGSPLLF